jgi:hypothetical protein
MKRDVIMRGPIKSSFLSVEKDTETILRKLFIESRPYSDELKKLLVINTKDCLDTSNENYQKIVQNMSLADLIDQQYICLTPKIRLAEHEEVKTYLILSFDSFSPNASNNPEFRDCMINFDIICPLDYWDIGDYRVRPLKIAGYIDGILNKSKLSGIGTVNFAGSKEFFMDDNFAGYTLMYQAVHGSDDLIPGDNDAE